jgi:ribosome-associated translation inhibitor RaiA
VNVRIQSQGFDLTPAIEAHIRKQLGFNLASFDSYIVSVDVFMSDINGPKGGRDKKAVISVRLTSRLIVTVERTRSDMYATLTLVARQAGRSVRRTLSKHRRMEKLALRQMQQYPQV